MQLKIALKIRELIFYQKRPTQIMKMFIKHNRLDGK